MTKLEKSIRHEIKYYGPRLRTGHYGAHGHSGWVPKDYRTLSSVYCDVENGIVTDIRLYAVGDARAAKDFYGDSIDITAPVEDYLRDSWDWDKMIRDIAEIVREQC